MSTKDEKDIIKFDLESFMRSGKEYQLKTFGVTLDAILSEVQERHLKDLSDEERVIDTEF